MDVNLGRIGIWNPERMWTGPDGPEAAAELDELGYGTLWLGAAHGDLRAPERLLGATQRLVLATGIVNVWQYEPDEVATAYHRVTGSHPDRFVLGLGMGHAPAAEALGKRYERPLGMLGRYLDELDTGDAAVPVRRRMLAALRPRALELAATRSAGAVPYLVTPEHTATACEVLRDRALLVPEQKVILSTDRAEAHALARSHLAYYLALPNYTRNFLAMGFTEDDLAGGGSDRLIDAMYAWGGVDAAAKRVREHVEAGADHVPVQVVSAGDGLPRDDWRALAPALLG